ncbi:MAG TPA: cupin domain-containing protein [Gaiellaceae bacterium]|nr:cupin domain-containing protein [Gaiellaceae bacterium]
MNLRDVPLRQQDMPTGFAHLRESVREALGGELIGCSLYEFEPGEQLWPYHYHWNNEEWLIVVAGRPVLRTPEGERELRPGDLVGFVEGEDGAHTLYNRSDAPARVVVFSTLQQGSVVYPDSDKVGAGPPWDRLYFRRGDAVDYWEGEAGD